MEFDDSFTEKVIGLAMKVHRALGPGFLESVYRNSLTFELRRAGFKVELDKHITVRYESVIVGDFVADMIVDDVLLLELKAISLLSKADEVQLVNYLTSTHHDVGLLLNFGASSLQFKRRKRRLSLDAAAADLHNPVNPV